MGSEQIMSKVKDQEDSLVMRVWASLVAQLVKNPPAMQETPFRLLGQEDPVEKG